MPPPSELSDAEAEIELHEKDLEWSKADTEQEIHVSGMNEEPRDSVNGEKDEGMIVMLKESGVYERIKMVASISGPVIVSYMLYVATSMLLLFYAGHLSSNSNDTTIFAGISMANVFANVSCFSILSGMTTALETLGSQSYGAKNYREVGIVFQRSVVVLSIMLIPIVFMWQNVESIFTFLGTEAAVCIVMKNYLRIRILTIPLDVVGKSYEKYLTCMGLTKPTMYSQIACILTMTGLGSLFVHHFQWGYESLAWAYVLSSYASGLCLFLTSFREAEVIRTMQPLSLEAFNNIKEFVSLGFPGLVMLCAEWWAFEALTILASQLGAEAVAAQTIIIQIASFAFMLPLALSIAAATMVGNAIGANEILLARDLSKLIVLCLFSCEALISPLIIIFGGHVISTFTDDSLVIAAAKRSIPILAAFTIGDGLSAVLSGITRGAGMQHLGAYSNIVSYYAFGLPLAWYLCFHTSLQVVGLMAGIAIGPILTDSFMAFLIFVKHDYVFSTSSYSELATGETVEEEVQKLAVNDKTNPTMTLDNFRKLLEECENEI